MAASTPLQGWRSSPYIYAHDWPTVTVNDFLNTTETNDPTAAWWTDSHIESALRFLERQYQSLGDVLIVDTLFAAQLYRAAVYPGSFPAKTDSDYCDNYKPWKTRIENHKFIFLPVNDGYSAVEASQQGQAAGVHWSFIVVDLQNVKKLRAYYIDSMTNSKQKYCGTGVNGRVAGKILQGVELLLDLPRHFFNARTLRYVPNQNGDNKFGGDVGACGPYMYAFMDHLLKHKTTLLKHGLKRSYNNPDRAVIKRSKKQLAFNSVVTRRKLAGDFFKERQRMERADPTLTTHQLNMQILTHFASGWTWEVFAAAFQVPYANTPRVPRRGHRPPRGTGGSGGGNGSDYDSDSSPSGPPESGPKGPTPPQSASNQPQSPNKPATQDTQTGATTSSARSRVDRKQPPAPTVRRMLQNPDELKVPDFGDIDAVDSESLKSWRKTNIVPFKIFRFFNSIDSLEQRALLQVLSGIDFATETHWRLLNIWKPLALKAGDDPDSLLPGVIAQRLQKHFHSVTAAAAEPLWGSAPPQNPQETAQVNTTVDPNKRKRGPADQGEGQRDPKKQKKPDLTAPDFSALDTQSLVPWVRMLPNNITTHLTKLSDGVMEISQPFLCRIILQTVYSNVFEDLAKETPLSTESKNLIRQWKGLRLVVRAKRLNAEEDYRKYVQTELLVNPVVGIKTSGGKVILQNCKLPDYTTDESKWPKDEENEDEEEENHDESESQNDDSGDPMNLDPSSDYEEEEECERDLAIRLASC